MFEFNFNSIKNFLFWKNFVDIFLVSFFFYLILLFVLRRRKIIFLLFGILIWILIYLLSEHFNLILTNFVFKWFISTGALIILAIVFALELRDFLHFSGTFGFNLIKLLKRTPLKDLEDKVNCLVDAFFEMAKNKIGALVVFEGEIPLDDLISNGYYLDGEISLPLILSIFDPSSPGHDGAVIIRKNKVYKFAAHLPLAKKPLKEHGLRHRAGVGISEVSDCLVVIVSEEKGTISLAKKGKIQKIENKFELKEKILNFLLKRKAEPKTVYIKSLIINSLRHLFIFATSFLISFYSFSLINKDFGVLQKTFILPVALQNLPQNLAIGEIKPSEVTVSLKGTKLELERLKISDLMVIVDLKNQKISPGKWNVIPLKEDNISIKLPKNVELVSITPSNIRVLLEENVEEGK
jgi:uncharacterized protein (TIGR00159 family)